MKKAIIGRKVGMTQIFDEAGKVVPVTVIEAGPCIVVQKKTADKEGYDAVQLGFDECAAKKLTKPELGHIERPAWPRSATCTSSALRTAPASTSATP